MRARVTHGKYTLYPIITTDNAENPPSRSSPGPSWGNIRSRQCSHSEHRFPAPYSKEVVNHCLESGQCCEPVWPSGKALG